MQEYSTDNTALAAHLLTEGYKLINISKNGARVAFIFSDSTDLQQATHDFELFQATSSNSAQLIQNFRTLVSHTRKVMP